MELDIPLMLSVLRTPDENLALASVDLTGSATPRYDPLGPDCFRRGHAYRGITVQTTPGCPRTWDFCSAPQVYENVFQTKTVAQVIRSRRSYFRRILRGPQTEGPLLAGSLA